MPMLGNNDYDDEDSFGLPAKPSTLDFNHVKRKMNIAKGFMDIGLLSANGNQLRNIINFGDTDSYIYYVVLTSIIVSLILQVASGVILMVSEKFDITDEDERELGELLSTITSVLVFVVLLINVFIASLGVDVANPFMHSTPPAIMNSGAISRSHSGPI